MKFHQLGAVASALVIGAVPAVALAGAGHGHPGGHPDGPSGASGPTGKGGPHGPHGCKEHSVAYVAQGTVDSSSPTTPLTQTGHHKYSGMLVVDVTRTNHHASGDKGKTVTYTLKDARVVFSHGTSNPPAAHDRVKVIGRITTLHPRCDQTGFTPTVTVRQVVVHRPRPSHPAGPAGPTGPEGPTGSTGPTGPKHD